MLLPLQGAARCCKVLQGAARCCLDAAVRVVCVLWSGHAGGVAAAGCCCRVLLAGAAVRVACALWGAPAGRVLLEGVLLSE